MSDKTPRVTSVNISKKKGTQKTPVDGPEEVVEQYGFKNDAHAGHWHRQVSFLASESIDKAEEQGLNVAEGSFGENFTTENLDLLSLPLGTQLKIGDDVLVEISQIGKVCHTRCAIYYAAGDCIFPREGIFGVVLHGGMVQEDDPIEIVKMGDGTCEYSPQEALDEVEAARAAGTL
ncbi:MAG: MOSC domain-containing protein [Coriobacteriales bacterium]|jgi:MOSC domain-containing protein YiiM